jgi:SAM-dependent methyltransferase
VQDGIFISKKDKGSRFNKKGMKLKQIRLLTRTAGYRLRMRRLLRTSQEALTSNKLYYEHVWEGSGLQEPERFNTWPILSALAADNPRRLEIGPGLRPRLPIHGTCFVDLSRTAVDQLNQSGGVAKIGDINALPYDDAQFDLVCAFDVIEHVPDDRRAFQELSRVLRDNGTLCFSVPLHEEMWSEFDEIVGHCHRFTPERIQEMITSNQLVLEKSAVYGMMPRARWVVDVGILVLKRIKRSALRLYHFLFPLVLSRQARLNLVSGLIDTSNVDSIFVICRRVPQVVLPHP